MMSTNTWKKWILPLSCCALAALALSGCSDKNSASQRPASADSGDLLARIKARGKITIAMEGTWAPWTYHDKDDKLTGFDVAVGAKIAEKIGVEPEFVEGKWDGLLAGLSAGRYDLMVNGVGVTPERSKAYNFSEPYAYDRVAVIVNEDDNNIAKLEDLRGKTTANTISSTYAQSAEKQGARVIGVDDLHQTFELLLARRIDATLNSEVTFGDYKKAHPDARIRIAFFLPEIGSIAVALKKDAATDSLRKVVDDAIAEMRADGELSGLSVRFFGIDITRR